MTDNYANINNILLNIYILLYNVLFFKITKSLCNTVFKYTPEIFCMHIFVRNCMLNNLLIYKFMWQSLEICPLSISAIFAA